MSVNDINSLSHTKWNCKYHIVFAPKYLFSIAHKSQLIFSLKCAIIRGQLTLIIKLEKLMSLEVIEQERKKWQKPKKMRG